VSAVLNTSSVHRVTSTDRPRALLDSVAGATERLAQSRQRLQLALTETNEANKPRVASADHGSPAWMDELKAIPGVGIVVQALSAWWAQYPFNTASAMALDAANAVAKPLATRHPLALVAGALLLGGMLAWSRPWRWILKPALFAGLMAQLSAKLVAQVPLQSWMSLLTALAQGRAPTPAPPATAAAESGPR
jgi:hypothetical protein